MRPIFGVCRKCNDGAEVQLVSRSKSLCLYHYREEKLQKYKEKLAAKKEYTGINQVSEKQKEIDRLDEKFYKEIWRTRPHVSEVSGADLPARMERWFMSHILPKKLYPHYRHNPENILLMTKAEHTMWDHGIPHGDKWQKVKDLRDRLRDEYNQKERDGEWR